MINFFAFVVVVFGASLLVSVILLAFLVWITDKATKFYLKKRDKN